MLERNVWNALNSFDVGKECMECFELHYLSSLLLLDTVTKERKKNLNPYCKMYLLIARGYDCTRNDRGRGYNLIQLLFPLPS